MRTTELHALANPCPDIDTVTDRHTLGVLLFAYDKAHLQADADDVDELDWNEFMSERAEQERQSWR